MSGTYAPEPAQYKDVRMETAPFSSSMERFKYKNIFLICLKYAKIPPWHKAMEVSVMTLQQLRYIVTIVNCGSISEAAKQLFITQPSLSNSVKELEKEMGISIFNRSPKDCPVLLKARSSYPMQGRYWNRRNCWNSIIREGNP